MRLYLWAALFAAIAFNLGTCAHATHEPERYRQSERFHDRYYDDVRRKQEARRIREDIERRERAEQRRHDEMVRELRKKR